MANITKPTAPGWSSVRARFIQAKARSTSPFTYQSQTYIHSGSRWSFELSLPPVKSQAVALEWMSFLRNLVKNDDTFSLAVTGYVPSDVTSPMTVRLAGSGDEAGWDVDRAKMHGFSFTVEQVIS